MKWIILALLLIQCHDPMISGQVISSQHVKNTQPAVPIPPTTSASALSFSSTTTGTVTFNWTNGNGASRIVVMRSLSPVNTDPVNGTTYSASTVYGSGSQIGAGNYVVKIGGSGPITVTGLAADTPYYVAVYECNSTQYRTIAPATGNGTTLQNHVSYGASTGVNALGDSYTVGIAASAPVNYYINKVGVYLGGATITNLAQSGTGVNTSEKKANNETTVPNSSTKLMTVLVGFNDQARAGAPGQTINKLVQGYRTIAINQFRKSSTAGGAAGVTRTGSWAGYVATSASGKYGSGAGGAVSTNTNGATASYTFTDTNVWVSFIGTDGVNANYGTVDITLDGVLQSTLNLNQGANGSAWTDGYADPNWGNQLNPVVVGFTGLTNASHTILITTKNTLTVPLDYFLIMNDPSLCAPLVASLIPYMTTAGYAGYPGNLGSPANTDICNAAIAAELDYFIRLLYPCVYFDMNGFTNITTDMDADGIHRNNAGHGHMDTAFHSLLNYP